MIETEKKQRLGVCGLLCGLAGEGEDGIALASEVLEGTGAGAVRSTDEVAGQDQEPRPVAGENGIASREDLIEFVPGDTLTRSLLAEILGRMLLNGDEESSSVSAPNPKAGRPGPQAGGQVGNG